MAALKSLLRSNTILARYTRYTNVRQILKRNFLSEAYRCQEAWANRLNSPILSKVKPLTLYADLDNSFSHFARANPVDIDIFTNVVQDEELVWELEDILFKLRLSPDTHKVRASTHHAVVRFLLDHDKKETLLRILRQKPAYGIFPDKYCSNIMLDTFIKQKDFTSAARIAVEEMLQENYDETLTVLLSLYACHMYLRNPQEWYHKNEIPEPEPEPKEEVKIRVRYLRNPFFDDHFDIMDPKQLLGKTFLSFGSTLKAPLSDYYSLLGFTFCGKWQDALKIANSLEKLPREILTFAINHIKEQTGELANTDMEQLSHKLKSMEAAATDEDITVELEKLIKNTVAEVEGKHIEELTQLIKDWEDERVVLLREFQEEEEREKIRKSIEERKEDLLLEEREIYFFDNEERLKLMIEEKQQLKDKLEKMKQDGLPISHQHTEMAGKMPTDVPHRKRKGESN